MTLLLYCVLILPFPLLFVSVAPQLMHELAPRLGHDLCRSFVALELAAFADDSTFRVRKATAQSFGNVAEIVGEQFTVNKLLPCYVRLSKDLIWGVRQSCAKSLVAVTRVVGLQTRTEVMIPMFERFAKDVSCRCKQCVAEVMVRLFLSLTFVLSCALARRVLVGSATALTKSSAPSCTRWDRLWCRASCLLSSRASLA